jgi:hypothetical protein
MNFSRFSFATTGLRSLKSIGGLNNTVNVSTKKIKMHTWLIANPIIVLTLILTNFVFSFFFT